MVKYCVVRYGGNIYVCEDHRHQQNRTVRAFFSCKSSTWVQPTDLELYDIFRRHDAKIKDINYHNIVTIIDFIRQNPDDEACKFALSGMIKGMFPNLWTF
jgi:hypothetical protein